jgi:hypothetical protein
MLDSHAQEIFDDNINMMVPWYLMASFAYYKQDDSIFSDAFFDNMSKVMLERWDEIEHFHKDHINKDDLAAGSFLGEYPSRVEGGLDAVRKKFYTKSGSVRKKKASKPKPSLENTMGAFGDPQDLFDFG